MERLDWLPAPGHLTPTHAWITLLGPVGSGKTTLLRRIAREAAGSRPVVALQLQPDTSPGYTGTGVAEFLEREDFLGHVENLGPGGLPLLIIDGGGPGDAAALGAAIRSCVGSDPVQVVYASSWTRDPLPPEGWEPVLSVELDPSEGSGLICGTAFRHDDECSTGWAVCSPSRLDEPARRPGPGEAPWPGSTVGSRRYS